LVWAIKINITNMEKSNHYKPTPYQVFMGLMLSLAVISILSNIFLKS